MKTGITLFFALFCSSLFAQFSNGWQHLEAPQWQGNAQTIRMATDGQVPLMAFNNADTDGAVQVQYFDGNNWLPLSTGNVTPDAVNSFDLAVVNGVPTLAFANPLNNDRIAVLEYNNGNWQPLGAQNFSANSARHIDLIEADGKVTLAYVSAPNGQLSVAQYDGFNWMHLGGLHFTTSSAYQPQLAYAQGKIYVAANDIGANGAITVWNFSQGHWQSVGQAGATPNSPNTYSFLATANSLMLAYDYNNSTVVSTFNGQTWQVLGNSLPPAADLVLLEAQGTSYLALSNADVQQHFQLWQWTANGWSLLYSDPTDLEEGAAQLSGCVVGDALVFTFNGLLSGQMSSIGLGSVEPNGPITGGSNDQNTGVITPLIPQAAPTAQVLEVYPNPSNGNVTISISEQTAEAALLVFDGAGRVVGTEQLQNAETSIDLDLPAGLYFLRLEKGQQTVTTKLIIQ